MNGKQFAKFSISFTLVLLILVGVLQIAIDPLFQYHQPWFGLKPVVTDERYQVAGMAKQFTFDNCILGNSLCENFKSSSFDKYYNGKTIKLGSAEKALRQQKNTIYQISSITSPQDMV